VSSSLELKLSRFYLFVLLFNDFDPVDLEAPIASEMSFLKFIFEIQYDEYDRIYPSDCMSIY
jgi:hypothetical protein